MYLSEVLKFIGEMDWRRVIYQYPKTITERFKKLCFFVIFNLKKEIEEPARVWLFLKQPNLFTGLKKRAFLALAIHKVSESF